MTKKAPDHSPATYVITNGEGAVYVGVTTNLEARIARHDERRGASFTRDVGGIWRAVHAQICDSVTEAETLETEWTETLNQTGTLPFLDFRPSAWNRKHYDRAFREDGHHANHAPRKTRGELLREIRKPVAPEAFAKLTADFAKLEPQSAPASLHWRTLGPTEPEALARYIELYGFPSGKPLKEETILAALKLHGYTRATDARANECFYGPEGTYFAGLKQYEPARKRFARIVRDIMRRRLADQGEERAEQDAGDRAKDPKPEQDSERHRDEPRRA